MGKLKELLERTNEKITKLVKNLKLKIPKGKKWKLGKKQKSLEKQSNNEKLRSIADIFMEYYANHKFGEDKTLKEQVRNLLIVDFSVNGGSKDRANFILNLTDKDNEKDIANAMNSYLKNKSIKLPKFSKKEVEQWIESAKDFARQLVEIREQAERLSERLSEKNLKSRSSISEAQPRALKRKVSAIDLKEETVVTQPTAKKAKSSTQVPPPVQKAKSNIPVPPPPPVHKAKSNIPVPPPPPPPSGTANNLGNNLRKGSNKVKEIIDQAAPMDLSNPIKAAIESRSEKTGKSAEPTVQKAESSIQEPTAQKAESNIPVPPLDLLKQIRAGVKLKSVSERKQPERSNDDLITQLSRSMEKVTAETSSVVSTLSTSSTLSTLADILDDYDVGSIEDIVENKSIEDIKNVYYELDENERDSFLKEVENIANDYDWDDEWKDKDKIIAWAKEESKNLKVKLTEGVAKANAALKQADTVSSQDKTNDLVSENIEKQNTLKRKDPSIDLTEVEHEIEVK